MDVKSCVNDRLPSIVAEQERFLRSDYRKVWWSGSSDETVHILEVG